MNRKQRRKLQSEARRSGNKDLEEKMKLLSKLKDKCRVCHTLFDKDDAEMVSSWMVVVRDEANLNLYCPDCWEKAQKIIESFSDMKELEDSIHSEE